VRAGLAMAAVMALVFGASGVAWAAASDVDPQPDDDSEFDPRPPPDDDVDPSYPDDDPEPEPEPDEAQPASPPPGAVPAPVAAPPPAPAPRPGEPPPSPTPPTQAPAPPATAPAQPPVDGKSRPPRGRLDGEDAIIVPPKAPPQQPMGIMTFQAIPTVFAGAGGKGNVKVSTFGKTTALQPSFGLGLQLDFPVHRYFALGTRAGIGFWNTRKLAAAGYGRSAYADLAINLRARVPILRDRAEFYLAVPIGFSLSLLNDVLSTTTGKGWVLGTHLGLKVYAKPSWGLLFEVGWARHSWRQRHDPNKEIEGKSPPTEPAPEAGPPLPTRTVRAHIQQFVFQIGLVFRL
jgi:hypothetical protein